MNRVVLFLFCSVTLFAVESITPSSRIDLKNSKGFYAGGDFLYWTVNQDSLFFGHGVSYSINHSHDVVLSNVNGDLKRTKVDWEPGFRVGVGYNWEYDYWNSDLKWTHFRSKAHGSTDDMTMTLIGHPSRQVADFSWDAKSWWHFHYDTIDLDNGRESWISKKISLAPFCGLRGVWIEQNYRVDYHSAQEHPGERNPVRSLPYLKSDFKGIGLRIGANANFNFNSHFGLNTNGTVSIIYGRFNCHMKTWEVAGEDLYLIADTRDGFWQATFVPSLGLYLKYGTFFSENRYFISGKVGWEQSLWFGLNKMIRYVHNFTEGKVYQMNDNLTLQGLICNLKLDF